MAVSQEQIQKLADLFEVNELKWRIGRKSKKGDTATALVYIDSRAAMDRLDEVCGPGNWQDTYKEGPNGGLLCGVSILVQGEDHPMWVTKWDGAENTDIESVKGGLSDAFKRACVKWGIARYLYSFPPSRYLPIDQYGNFQVEMNVPDWAVPKAKTEPSAADRLAAYMKDEGYPMTDKKGYTRPEVKGLIKEHFNGGFGVDELAAFLDDLPAKVAEAA